MISNTSTTITPTTATLTLYYQKNDDEINLQKRRKICAGEKVEIEFKRKKKTK
jgi:hypothetical protein